MAKSSVGSLYYEILLNPAGYKSGAAKIRKEDDHLQRNLTENANERISDMDRLAAKYERLHKANWRLNARDADKRNELRAELFAMYRREVQDLRNAEEEKTRITQTEAQERFEAILRERRKLDKYAIDQASKKQRTLDAIRRLGAGAGDGGGDGAPDGPLGWLNNAQNRFGQISGAIGRVTMTVWPLVQAFNFLKRGAMSLFGVLAKGIKLVDDFAMHQATLSTMLDGNTERAAKLIDEVEAYAMQTSLSVDAGLEMAESLLVLGVNVDMVGARLRQFNKVARGDAEKFKRVAKAYTDVLGAGVLKRTEWRQFTEAGVAINKYLEQVLRAENRLTGSIDDMMGDKLITARDVGKALDAMGKAMEGLDYQRLQTVGGQLENINEEIQSMVRRSAALKELSSVLVDNISKMAEMFSVFKEIGKENGAINAVISGEIHKINAMLESMLEKLQAATRLYALLMHGDAMYYEKKAEAAKAAQEAEQKAAEEAARRQDEALARSMARHHAEQEMAENYLAARKEVIKVEETAQSKYDDWRRRHNIDEMSAMDQRLLDSQYRTSAESEASAARRREMDDIARRQIDYAAKRLESALNAALPQDAFKQNSVEEFRYMQAQRKQAERDRREQERFDQKMERDQANADRQWEATMNITTITDTATSI